MAINKQNIEAKPDDWLVPQWVKFIVTCFTVSAGVIFVLSVFRMQKALWGLSTELIAIFALGIALLLMLVTVAFWSFPNSTFTLFLYWLIRFLREQLCIFALLGIVYLVTVRAGLFSFRGGIPLLNLILLFLLGWLVKPVSSDHFPRPWMKRFSTFLEKQISKINSMPVVLLRVVVALLPILIVCFVIYLGLNASLQDYGPYSFWNDETGYWLWIRSFSYVGLNAGYNAPNELPAPATFNHYGEGGPFYIYTYGAIAGLIGWLSYLPILINFLILALAIFLFTHYTKLDPVQVILVGLITIVTWPILLYLPMTTPETFNQAIGFILAVVFFRLLTHRNQISLPTRIAFVFLIYLATLIRLSWGLLLIPVIFYSLQGNVFRRIVLSVILGLGLYVSAILIMSYLVPPTNNSIFVNIKGSLVQGPEVFIKYIGRQFLQMFKFRELNPNIAVMFQIVIIIGWNMIRLARMLKSKISISAILQSRSVFDIYNMATLAAAGLLFYLQVGFYRTFTPSILIVYLLQAAKKDYRLLATLLTINVLFFHSYMTFYAHVGDARIIQADFTVEFPERAQLQSEMERSIVFDRTTQNPWCNTLLIPQEYYDYRLTVIPPGIGISWIQDIDALQTPLRSKYLLFDQETYEAMTDKEVNLKLLKSFSIGDLYQNLDSGCEIDQ